MPQGSVTTNELMLVGIIMAVSFLGWWVAIRAFKEKETVVAMTLVTEGLVLRLLTVYVIVAMAGILALCNRMIPEVAAILSGVAGYVLGGIPGRLPRLKDERDDAAE